MRTQRTLALAALLALGAAPGGARGDEVPVPVSLQADLLFMIAAHDRNLPARAGGEVRTLVVTRAGDDSTRAAAQIKAAAKPAVAGMPHAVEVAPFAGAAALADACKAKRISIVYLTPGFSVADAAAIGRALEGANVLTASAAPAMVRKGVVLGFDLVSGRAKLLVDLTQAAKQHVAFGADVLGLMAVSQ